MIWKHCLTLKGALPKFGGQHILPIFVVIFLLFFFVYKGQKFFEGWYNTERQIANNYRRKFRPKIL